MVRKRWTHFGERYEKFPIKATTVCKTKFPQSVCSHISFIYFIIYFLLPLNVCNPITYCFSEKCLLEKMSSCFPCLSQISKVSGPTASAQPGLSLNYTVAKRGGALAEQCFGSFTSIERLHGFSFTCLRAEKNYNKITIK